jgi:hypothetical protein
LASKGEQVRDLRDWQTDLRVTGSSLKTLTRRKTRRR